MKNPIPVSTDTRAVFFALISILSIGFAGWPEAAGSADRVQEISARRLFEMVSSSTPLVIIDISTPGEYDEGHIKGSLRGDLRLIRTQPEKHLDGLGVKKSDTIILTCEIGNKSYRTVGILISAGYQNVYNLAGGKIDWARSGYDLAAGDGKK